MIKGWINTSSSPEKLLNKYIETGDKTCLSLLVEQFNKPLFHYLLSMSDRSLAEDVVQTTWLKVLKLQHLPLTHQNVKGWLYTIARNTLFDELKRMKRWQWQSLDETTEVMEWNPLINKNAERLVQFNQALEQLPFFQREAFIFQQDGFSVSEIAQITNESFETVKSRLRYARKHLKQALGNNHE